MSWLFAFAVGFDYLPADSGLSAIYFDSTAYLVGFSKEGADYYPSQGIMLAPSGRGLRIESSDRLRLIKALVDGDTAFLLGYQNFYSYIRPGIIKMWPDTDRPVCKFYAGAGFKAEIKGGAIFDSLIYLWGNYTKYDDERKDAMLLAFRRDLTQFRGGFYIIRDEDNYFSDLSPAPWGLLAAEFSNYRLYLWAIDTSWAPLRRVCLGRASTPGKLLKMPEGFLLGFTYYTTPFFVRLGDSLNPIWAKGVKNAGRLVEVLEEDGFLYALLNPVDGLAVVKLDTAGNVLWALRGQELVPAGLNLSPEEVLVAGLLYRDGETDFLFFSVSKDGLQHPVCLAETTFSTVDTLLSLSEDSLPELDLSLDLALSNYGCGAISIELVPYDPCILPGCAETPREGGLRVEGAKGSLLVWAPEPTLLEVYEPSGRLLLSKRVPRGLGRIRLKRGVYLWRAGPRSGSALVR